MIEEAVNKWVLVIRDDPETESGGLLLPDPEKTHSGTIQAIGDLVTSEGLKAAKGRKCLFHPTGGWDITYDGVTYAVVRDEEIIALP